MMDSGNPVKLEQKQDRRSTMETMIRRWKRFSKTIAWTYTIHLTLFHLGFVVALSSYVFGLHSVPIKKLTLFWTLFYGHAATFGGTAGAHRMWTHRSFKAKLSAKILLMLLYSALGMHSLRISIKDHRQHHKYTDTDADPHNANRGLFYSHIGWLLTKRTEECMRKRREIDMSDIHTDPVVVFQDKYTMELGILFCFLLPTVIPVLFWDETILHAVFTQCFLRYIYHLHTAFLVNSIGHYWGYRPYNRSASAVDNPLLSTLVIGDASHNYHHTFPSDYKGAEFPEFSLTTRLILLMAKLGLVYDLKEPSPELVKNIRERNEH